jgi:hypothetical protein
MPQGTTNDSGGLIPTGNGEGVQPQHIPTYDPVTKPGNAAMICLLEVIRVEARAREKKLAGCLSKALVGLIHEQVQPIKGMEARLDRLAAAVEDTITRATSEFLGEGDEAQKLADEVVRKSMKGSSK